MDNRGKYLSNFIWRSLERWGALGVSFIVSIVLARLLSPDAYGTIAIVTVLITILDIFLDSGFGNALVQKKDSDDVDFSSVFYFNVGFSIVLYFILFLSSPIVADFFNVPELKSIIRIMGLSVIVTGLKNIQQSYVTKNLLFKKFFFATLIGTIIAAFIGILFAYLGFGVWALVAQYLSNNLIDTVILWFTVKWRPRRVFSFERVKKMYPFAWRLLASSLIFQGYTELRQLLVGKFYTKADLAYYNQGYKFPNLISTNLNVSIRSIIFPAMSKAQDDIVHVKNMLKRTIQVSQYVICPFVLGLAACADSFVKAILTEKWLPCVPYLQLFCLAFILGQMGTANQNAAMSIGRSDIKLKTEIVKTAIDIIVLLITIFISPMAIAIGYALSTIPRTIVCSWPTKKLLGYSFLQQIKDISPNLILGIIMAICVWLIRYLELSALIALVIQIVIGIIIYVGLSIVTKNESFIYILNTIKTMKKGKNHE